MNNLPASNQSEPKNEIVVYNPDETIRLDVRLENETVWLTQDQIANLFGTQRPAITKHLANIYRSGELEREGTCSILEHMGNCGNRSYRTMFYNLDAILSVGYRVNSRNATMFRRWATQVLKTYLLKGYAVNARLNQLEDRMDRRLAKTEADVIELKEKVDFFVQTKEPPLQGVFYDGQLWDARALVLSLVSRAKRALILIDNWATPETLDLFAKKRKGVRLTIFTSEHYDKNHVPHRKISDVDIKTFNAQYPKLAVRYTDKFHDRFIIIDDKELYLIGASLKDLGRKCFAFTKLDAGEIPRIKKAAFVRPRASRPPLIAT